MRKLILALVWLCALLGASSLSEARAKHSAPRAVSSVALVGELRGKVEAKAEGQAKGTALELGDEVFAKETLALNKGAALTLVWHRGGPRFHLTGKATVKVLKDGLKATPAAALTRLPEKSAVRYSPADARRPREGIMASTQRDGPHWGTNRIRMNAPLGATFDKRPTFSWVSIPMADTVTISLAREGAEMPLWTQELKGTESTLAYPADKPDLIPGKWYRWKVIIPSDGRTAANETALSFFVAQPEVRTRLENLRLAMPRDADDLPSHIVLIRALWDEGFFSEAEKEAKALAETHADDAAIQHLSEHLTAFVNDVASGSNQRILEAWSKK